MAAPPTFELAVDEPVIATIAGQPVTLKLATGTVDHVILNDSAVQRVQLIPVRGNNKADMKIGDGGEMLSGRRGGAWLNVAGHSREQQFYWFPGLSPLPFDGSIGPLAFGVPRVLLRFRAGEAPLALQLPLAKDIDSTALGLIDEPSLTIALTVDAAARRSLPLVSTAAGADLASALGGQFVGEPWEEEILLGVRRPVRRLVLAKPLQLGPLRFDALAVEMTEPTARARQLPKGQKMTAVVTLSRTQLEEQACTTLLIDTQRLQFELNCAGLGFEGQIRLANAPADDDMANAKATSPPGLPSLQPGSDVAALAAITVAPLLTPDGWLELQVEEPLSASIRNEPVQLALRTGALGGVLLNDIAARRVGIHGAATPVYVSYAGRGVTVIAGTDVNVTVADRYATLSVKWIPGGNQQPWSGSIELLTIPYDRIRLLLASGPPANHSLQLRLGSLSRREHAHGVVELPGLANFFIDATVQQNWRLPLVSAALAADLAKVYGGQLQGPVWQESMPFGLRRSVRQLVLSRPLVLGPLRFDALAVQYSSVGDKQTRLARGQKPIFDADADPDEMLVRGRTAVNNSPGRYLNLSRTQLEQLGCTSLAVDKPARRWELTCSGLALP